MKPKRIHHNAQDRSRPVPLFVPLDGCVNEWTYSVVSLEAHVKITRPYISIANRMKKLMMRLIVSSVRSEAAKTGGADLRDRGREIIVGKRRRHCVHSSSITAAVGGSMVGRGNHTMACMIVALVYLIYCGRQAGLSPVVGQRYVRGQQYGFLLPICAEKGNCVAPRHADVGGRPAACRTNGR